MPSESVPVAATDAVCPAIQLVLLVGWMIAATGLLLGCAAIIVRDTGAEVTEVLPAVAIAVRVTFAGPVAVQVHWKGADRSLPRSEPSTKKSTRSTGGILTGATRSGTGGGVATKTPDILAC